MHFVGDRVTVNIPGGIWGTGEQFGHVGPPSPGSSYRGHESGARAAGHGNGHFLAFLNASDEIGGVLAQLTQSNNSHAIVVAHVLHEER
jgi:hypothetical protein